MSSTTDMADQKSGAKTTAILATVLIAFFGIAAALLVVELGFRALLAFGSKDSGWSDRPSAFFKDQKAATLQDYYYPESKAPGNFRIAVIGDSFTFAPYMQFDDTFPKRLERFLNLNDTEKKAEVINYGVPGYSTSHEVATVEKAISQGADLIVLQITLNDPQRKAYRPTGLTQDNPFTRKDRAGSGVLKHWKSLQFVLQRIHNTSTHQAYIDYYFRLFNRKENWKSFRRSLKRIARKSNEANVKLVAVLFPLFGLPLDIEYPFHPLHQKVNGLLDKLDVPTLDLFPNYQGIPLPRLQVIPEKDFHPNEIGHRIAAEAIYNWLANQNLIPDLFVAAERFSERTDIRPRREIQLLKQNQSLAP